MVIGAPSSLFVFDSVHSWIRIIQELAGQLLRTSLLGGFVYYIVT